MILSRTMRPSDYQELAPEVDHLNKTIALCGPVPYIHRTWEYALILRTLLTSAPFLYIPSGPPLEVADFGASDGLSPAMMLREGFNVSVYEVWDGNYGNKYPDARNKAEVASKAGGSQFRFINRGLGSLIDEDKGRYDVALCISVIEHIQDEVAAFNDIMASVKEHGVIILTMDFFPANEDTKYYNWLRARIYNEQRMLSLLDRAREKGFDLIDKTADWSWNQSMIMVQGEYGFSSIVLTR